MHSRYTVYIQVRYYKTNWNATTPHRVHNHLFNLPATLPGLRRYILIKYFIFFSYTQFLGGVEAWLKYEFIYIENETPKKVFE